VEYAERIQANVVETPCILALNLGERISARPFAPSRLRSVLVDFHEMSLSLPPASLAGPEDFHITYSRVPELRTQGHTHVSVMG